MCNYYPVAPNFGVKNGYIDFNLMKSVSCIDLPILNFAFEGDYLLFMFLI